MDKMYCKRVVAIAVALSSYLWSGWPDPHLSYRFSDRDIAPAVVHRVGP